MSYDENSDVKGQLSTRTAQPHVSMPQRTDGAIPAVNNSSDVKVDPPVTAKVIPFRPIAKDFSSLAQVSGELGAPSGTPGPKDSGL